MSTNTSNLFAFDRALPSPFDTLKSKRLSVSSKYGDGTASTLCASVIKGIHAVFRCMDGGEGAVGVIDHRTVAEYKSSIGPDAYHLVVYDSNSGSLMASVYDKATEVLETYTVHKTARDGAAIMMALFPVFTMDEEFSDTCSKYHDQYSAGFPDVNLAAQYMAILCDNAYRRIKDDACPAHIKVTIDRSGNIMRVGQAQLDSGALTPNRVAAGEFTIFAKTGSVTYKKAAVLIDPKDFVGKYQLHPRTLTPLEQMQVPVLGQYKQYQEGLLKKISDGSLKQQELLAFQELNYRIATLELMQAYCRTAPVTTELGAIGYHYQLVIASSRALLTERRFGPKGDEQKVQQRATALKSLEAVFNDQCRRFQSFNAGTPELYRKSVQEMINTVLPVWVSYRTSYINIEEVLS